MKSDMINNNPKIKNQSKRLNNEELADLSDGLSGRNIRQITMTMGIRLTVGKMNAIESSVVASEVDKIKAAAQNTASTGKVEHVEEKDLPKIVLGKL